MRKTYHKNTPEHIGEEIILQGWVNTRRDMGKIIFIDLRDSTGLIQVVFAPGETSLEAMELIKDVRNEYVLEIQGVVKKRGEKQINPNIIPCQ